MLYIYIYLEIIDNVRRWVIRIVSFFVAFDNSSGRPYTQPSSKSQPPLTGRSSDDGFTNPSSRETREVTSASSSHISFSSPAGSSTLAPSPLGGGLSKSISTYSNVGPTSQGAYENVPAHTVPPSSSSSSSAFSAGRLEEETSRAADVEAESLREVLQAITKERDLLRRNQERVSADWEGKVHRLEARLRQLESGTTDEVWGVIIVTSNGVKSGD